MLSSQGFDLWADGYDASVGLSDEENSYPFAGYKQVLGSIYRTIRTHKPAGRVLDLGFGTGTLTHRLYQDGYAVTGVDFSARMLELAQAKMPDARLLCHDFAKGLPEDLGRFDVIISTYALHHLTDEQKTPFLRSLRKHLADDGLLLIGDVAFSSRRELEACRKACGADWDEDEFYFVCDELSQALDVPVLFERCSFCAGVLVFPCTPT